MRVLFWGTPDFATPPLRALIGERNLDILRQELGAGDLVFLRLGFLEAQDVGALLREPVEEPLARRGADAVGVEADDAQIARPVTKVQCQA